LTPENLKPAFEHVFGFSAGFIPSEDLAALISLTRLDSVRSRYGSIIRSTGL
jgi:hypothetical protein